MLHFCFQGYLHNFGVKMLIFTLFFYFHKQFSTNMITTKKKSNYARTLNKELKVEEDNQCVGNCQKINKQTNKPTNQPLKMQQKWLFFTYNYPLD